MLQHKPTFTLLKASLGVCVIGIVFFVAACQDEEIVTNEHSEVHPNPAATEAPPAEFSMLVETYSNIKPPLSGIKAEVKDKAILISAENEIHIISKFKDKETYERTAEYARQLEGQNIGNKSVTEGLKKIGNGQILHIREKAENNNTASAKNTQSDKTSGGDRIFEVVEHQPNPKGGMESFYKMVGENLVYPEEAIKNGIEGRVYIQFVVEKDGTVSEVKAVKGVGHGLDEAAAEVIGKSLWEPGRQNGEAVAVRMVMPIMFRL